MEYYLITVEGKLIYSSQEDIEFLADVSYLLLEPEHLSPEYGHPEVLVGSSFKGGSDRYGDKILITHVHSVGHDDFKGFNWILVVQHKAKEVFAPIAEFKNRLLIISLALTMLGILMAYFISISITKNIKKLQNATIKIGRGNLDTRIDIESNDEIGQLAKTFKQMAKDLKVSTVRGEELAKEVTERKKAEKTIQLQLERFNVLRFIDMTITASLDLHDTLDILLIQVTRHLGIDAASILLLNPRTQLLEYVSSKGFQTNALKYTKLRIGESNAGRAALERRIVIRSNLKENIDGFVSSELFAEEDFAIYYGVPLISKDQVKGVLELFHRTPLSADPEWLEFLETIADQAAMAIDNASLFDELTSAYDTTIEGWSRAMDLRDKETEGHTKRVAEMTLRIAREFGIKEEELVHMRRGALLHDIGKMGVPDHILLKPTRLTKKEWEMMKRHSEYAYDMLYRIEYLRPALDIPHYHHEKWDGTGYPNGLKGEEIPLAARIFAVVDVWDALCSDRPYRPAWAKKKVREHIRSLAGTHFNPKIVEVFLKMEW